jgi:hypothetical protein
MCGAASRISDTCHAGGTERGGRRDIADRPAGQTQAILERERFSIDRRTSLHLLIDYFVLPQDSAATQQRCSGEHRSDVFGTHGAPHTGHDTSQRPWFGGVGDRGQALSRWAETFCRRVVGHVTAQRPWYGLVLWETGDRPNPDCLVTLLPSDHCMVRCCGRQGDRGQA